METKDGFKKMDITIIDYFNFICSLSSDQKSGEKYKELDFLKV